MSGPKWIWEPTRDFIERTNVYRFMKRLGFTDREEFLRFSRENPEKFWGELAKEIKVDWDAPYEKVLDTSQGPEWARWFVGGKLNIAWNCLDRHARGSAATRTAIVWEGEDGAQRILTFAELYAEASRLAHALKGLGLVEGDRVALSMPMVPEVVTILYACFKLGLIVVPIFSGFGPQAIATRLKDSGVRVLFTADFLQRRGKLIPLKEKIDQAVLKVESIERVVVYRYKGEAVPWVSDRDVWWHDLVKDQPASLDSLPLDSEDKALILYTSGTTGKPKGAVHSHAGALVQTAKEIFLGFDRQPDDLFFWLSDVGWMMGPWTIMGNHHFAGRIFLYDGAFDFPKADRLWEMIARHRITTLGISPTAIRLLMGRNQDLVKSHDLSSLRLLGSTGEPWDETSYMWFFEKVGGRRCPIINISGGTEIIGCFLFPLPIQPLKPCTLGGPAPGMATEVFDEDGHPVRGKKGYLVCTRPSPSMTRGLWNASERYIETYWSRWKGVWYHGDWASVDEDGCWYLHGRADETFNVAGRKVGPAEVEQALLEHPSVSEAAVVGVPDELTGERIVAFVVLKAGAEAGSALTGQLKGQVAKSLGSAFRPRAIHVVKELPKTLSGKIVRRAIRDAYLGEEIGDLSTVENPAALKSIRPATTS
ncbi:MAG TPA: AMP-binding protein [Terriglobia bacterium]|nr:AMP-binding protein [Terriglobia bacterium]